jgi:hypothetical protein
VFADPDPHLKKRHESVSNLRTSVASPPPITIPTQQHTTQMQTNSCTYNYHCTYFFFIWRRANPLLGAFEGVGPVNLDFFWPKWHSLRLLQFQGPKKSRFSWPNPYSGPYNGPCNGYCPRHKNNRYINSYNLQRAMSRPQTAAPAAPAPSQLVISDPNRLIPVQAWPENTLQHYSTYFSHLFLKKNFELDPE